MDFRPYLDHRKYRSNSLYVSNHSRPTFIICLRFNSSALFPHANHFRPVLTISNTCCPSYHLCSNSSEQNPYSYRLTYPYFHWFDRTCISKPLSIRWFTWASYWFLGNSRSCAISLGRRSNNVGDFGTRG